MPRTGDDRPERNVVQSLALPVRLATVSDRGRRHACAGAGADARQADGRGRGRRAAPSPTPARRSARQRSRTGADAGGVRRGHQVALRRHVRRVPQQHRARAGGLDLDALPFGRIARDRSRLLGTDPRRSSRPARCRPPDVERPDAQINALVEVPRGRVRAGRRRREARSGPRHRAAAEPRRVHEHDPRSAGDRLPRRPELSDRRFRRRLRQHRRRPDRVAGADGEVPLGRRADRRAGDRAPSRCRSRSKSSTACASRTSAGSIRATSKRRTASISTPTTTLRIGLPGQRAKDAAPVTLGLWVDGKLAQTQADRDEAVRAGLLQSVFGRADSRPAAGGRSHAAARLHRRCVRQDAREGGHLQGHGQQVDRLGDRRRAVRVDRTRSRAARRSWSAIRRPAPSASTGSCRRWRAARTGGR